MNLLKVALIKASEEKRHSHSSSSSKSVKTHKTYSYSSSSSTYKLEDSLKPDASYAAANRLENCVYNIIENTPEITAIVETYIKKLDDAKNARVSELNAELETLCEPSAAISKKYNDAANELKGIGFDMRLSSSNPDSDYGCFWYVEPAPKMPHPGYCTSPDKLTLDGVEIKKEVIESGANPFEVELSNYLKKYPNYKKDYESLMAEIASLEKRKLALFLSSTKKEELAALRTTFEQVKSIYDQVGVYLASAEKYRNLSPEQKAKLTHFLDVQAEFKQLSDTVLLSREKSLQITGYGKPTEVQDLIQKSKDEALASLTPEEKAAFDEIPSTVATIILGFDDEQFTDFTHHSHYYYNDSFYPKREIMESLVMACVAQAKEKHQQQLASTPTGSGFEQ